MVVLNNVSGQLPLIHFVESDDLYFQDQPDVLWFDVLRNLDYRGFKRPPCTTTNDSGSLTSDKPNNE